MRRRFRRWASAKSNWDVMRLLARALGFDEPWLQQPADEVIDEMLAATAAQAAGAGGSDAWKRCAQAGPHSAALWPRPCRLPTGVFPRPAARWSCSCQRLAEALGLDPLPGYVPDCEDDGLAGGWRRMTPDCDPAEAALT